MIGVGCATAEGAYAGLAVFGFATLLADIPWIQPASTAVAAVVLIIVGLALALGKGPAGDPASEGDVPPADSAWKAFGVGFALTALNPTLVATWATVVLSLNGSGVVSFEPLHAIPFGLAVGIGIGGWYLLVVQLVQRYRGRFRPGTLTRVIQVVGWLLVAVGLYFTVDFLVSYVFN